MYRPRSGHLQAISQRNNNLQFHIDLYVSIRRSQST